MATRHRTNRISERISGSVRRQIAAGRLVPGERLPAERDMTRRYHVSRVSVREAYRALEQLGLVIVRRGAAGGAFVTEPGQAAIQESLSLLLRLARTSSQELIDAWMIQPTIARLAARHASAADVARLRRVVAREEAAAVRQEHGWLHRRRFHRAVAACSRNLPLAALVSSVATLTLEPGATADSWEGSAAQMCKSHRAIVDAIERHDEDAAEHLMRELILMMQPGKGPRLSSACAREGRPA